MAGTGTLMARIRGRLAGVLAPEIGLEPMTKRLCVPRHVRTGEMHEEHLRFAPMNGRKILQ